LWPLCCLIMTQKAVYAGSFDPITWGHLDVVSKVLPLFEELHIVVAHNLRKKSFFSDEERVTMISHLLKEQGLSAKCRVESFDGLVADYCKQHQIPYLVRGLRALSDYENELQIATMNKRLNPELETVLVMADEKHFFVSSSLVKEVAHHGGALQDLLPPSIEKILKDKIAQKGNEK
jgi:pantetheine-phosphate adenylyltransferase